MHRYQAGRLVLNLRESARLSQHLSSDEPRSVGTWRARAGLDYLSVFAVDVPPTGLSSVVDTENM